jgi:hypothetical protein
VAHVRRLLIAPAILAALVVGTLGALPVQAAGRTLYIAPNGRDFADDGWTVPPNSIDTPWRTIEWGVRRARPGDTIVVRGGTYTEVVGWGAVDGTSSARITLEGYPGERVVVKGVVAFKGANYWTIRRINVTRDPGLGRKEALVSFTGGVGWQFLDAEVWGNVGVSNVMINSSSTYGVPRNYRVAGNCIHDNDAKDAPMTDHNLYLNPGLSSGPGRIERNIFFNAENGAHIKAAGTSSSQGSAYVTIAYNTMVRGAAGVVVGYGTHHTTMWRNLVGIRSASAWPTYNAALLANHATGYSNTSGYLAVWGYPKSISHTNSTTRPIKGVNTVWVRPTFDSTSACDGFHVVAGSGGGSGRYAP